MIELACPESCSYLIEARTNASRREFALRQQETAQNPRDLLLSDAGAFVLDAIGGAIASVQRTVGTAAFRELQDSDVLAAVEIAIKNIETEESGLIYEHRASAQRVDELSRKIREHIDEIGKGQPADTRPRRSDILRALTVTRNTVKAHIQRATDDHDPSNTFIRYTVLFYPWPKQATRPLIVS